MHVQDVVTISYIVIYVYTCKFASIYTVTTMHYNQCIASDFCIVSFIKAIDIP